MPVGEAIPITIGLLALWLAGAAQAQFTYTTSNNEITITGYTGPSGAVIIPSTINSLPVTSIGNNAFSYRTNLTSVTIPSGVTNIGPYAFIGCSVLTSVTLPNSVISIGFNAFQDCTSITSIMIPTSLTSIATQVFEGVDQVIEFRNGESVSRVGEDEVSHLGRKLAKQSLLLGRGMSGVKMLDKPSDSDSGDEEYYFHGTGAMTPKVP